MNTNAFFNRVMTERLFRRILYPLAVLCLFIAVLCLQTSWTDKLTLMICLAATLAATYQLGSLKGTEQMQEKISTDMVNALIKAYTIPDVESRYHAKESQL